MSDGMRVFVNSTPIDVPPGTAVQGALLAHDPSCAARLADGTAVVTDARGIELPLDTPLSAGSILRLIVRARRGERPDGDDDG
jgi:hypothetical protein